jgi:hypothetical protein
LAYVAIPNKRPKSLLRFNLPPQNSRSVVAAMQGQRNDRVLRGEASVWRVSVESDLLDRFDLAWRRFEVELRRRFRVPVRGRGDVEALLLEAGSSGQLPRATVDFLQAARRVRNACSHVTFEDYAGPIAAVPLPVVRQLERLADFLASIRGPVADRPAW